MSRHCPGVLNGPHPVEWVLWAGRADMVRSARSQLSLPLSIPGVWAVAASFLVRRRSGDIVQRGGQKLESAVVRDGAGSGDGRAGRWRRVEIAIPVRFTNPGIPELKISGSRDPGIPDF